MTKVDMLENKEADITYIVRNHKAIAHVTLIPNNPVSNRIGAAEGKIKVPNDFATWDKEVEDLFGEDI